LPVKGYDSVNLPSGLYKKVKALIKRRNDLGYRSITEFVAEAVRNRIMELSETKQRNIINPSLDQKQNKEQKRNPLEHQSY
jgi:metal-responsive CopG/Arc/MetJ family transcriptional regulator